MLLKTSVHLLILVSLIISAGCTWTTPASGDTFRYSVDVVNNYIYFEKIGDTSMYYGASVSSVSALHYGCGFGNFGQIQYNLDPTTLGILGGSTDLTISGNNVISNQVDGANTVGSVTVGSSGIYSFQATLIPDYAYDRVCTGFWVSSTWYQLCTTYAVSYTSVGYSSCGTCDCACATCFGPQPTQCNSCSAGYYQFSTTTCYPCATGCAICSGGGTMQCSDCSNGYYLSYSSCYTCATGCAICSGGSNTQCSSCSSGYYLQPSSTTCSNSCPNGYYADSTTHTCPTCVTGCAICTGGSNTQCSSCSSGYYLQPSSTTCSNSCPNGYYPDSTTHSCPTCAIGCAICSGGSNTQCSSCSSGYYLQPSSTTCSNSCPNGYYADSTTHTCPTCVTGCAICTGGSNTQCSSCSSGYYLQPSSTTCSNSCPNGYYPDSTTHSCPTCAIGCAICSGGSNTQCSSCSSGYYLQPSSTTCSNSCPSNGYYPDSTTHTCPTCNSECAICTGDSNTQCSSCSSGYYLQPSPTSTTCLSSCPTGYYTNSTNNTCLSCTTGCVSCESTATCDVCAQEYYFLPGKTACVTTCSSGLCTYAQNTSCIDCLFYCGNGERMSYEECDDGNLINGDGCSSVCTVEQNWVCQGGSPTQKDTCTCANTTGVHQFGNSCLVLNSSTQQIIAQTGSYANTISATTEDSLIGIQMVSGAFGSTFATALNALHVLMLLKYCDVGYPPNVEELFDLLSDNSSSSSSSSSSKFTNLLDFFTKLGNQHSQGTITPSRFQKFGVQPFFLSNIGSSFFIIAVLLVIILFLNILKKVIKNRKANAIISDSLLPSFQWNTVLSTIIGGQTKLALAWCLQFSNPFVETYNIINIGIAIVSILALIAVYIVIIFKISWNWSIVREKLFLGRQTLSKAEIRQKQLDILWKSYILGGIIGRYFVVLQLLKITLFVAIICFLYNYPIVQCYALIVLSALYLLIIIFGRPFSSLIDTLSVISNETCLFLEEIIMAVFAYNKNRNFISLSTGNVLGWVLIGVLFLSLGLNLLSIILTVIRLIVEMIRKRREKRATEKSAREKSAREESAREMSAREMSAREKSNRVSNRSGRKKRSRPVRPLDVSRTDRSHTTKPRGVITTTKPPSKYVSSRINPHHEVVDLSNFTRQDLINPKEDISFSNQYNRSQISTRRNLVKKTIEERKKKIFI